MNIREREQVESQVDRLSVVCPYDDCNPSFCPLYEVRKLPAEERFQWARSLSDGDLEYLGIYHQICLQWRTLPEGDRPDEPGNITGDAPMRNNLAEAALRERDEHLLLIIEKNNADFRAMFEVASIGLAQADPQTGQWLRVNKRMCVITGYTTEELLETRFSELTHPEDREKDWEEFQRVVKGEIPEYHLEKRYVRKDGSLVWVNVNVTVIRDTAGRALRTMAAIEDITERKRLEQEVLEISGQEMSRIGQELHDDICQRLAGTALIAGAHAKKLAKESPENAGRAQEIAEYTQQTLAAARILAHGLTPAVIHSAGGLAGALRKLAANTGDMFNIRCVCDCAGAVEARDEAAALHLYRIAQEAIGNAVRHGGAHEIEILLHAHEDRASMVIRDDGCGIPKSLPRSSGMGLRSMRNRAEIIGATIEIRPGIQGGTEVVCTYPKAL